jgi:DNA-binding NarL/FixJ family response regulator
MSTRIFLVEDHASMRAALQEFLDTMSGFEVCGAVENADSALGQITAAKVDLALIDVSLPGMNGIDLVRALTKRCPTLFCVMLSGHGEQNYVRRSLAAGASGFILKGNPDELPIALRAVLDGEIYVSDGLLR